MTEIRVPAHQVKIGDHITTPRQGRPGRVAGCRIQGAQPEVVIIWADRHPPSCYPAGELLDIDRPDDPTDPHPPTLPARAPRSRS